MLVGVSVLLGMYVVIRFALAIFGRRQSREFGTWGLALVPSMFVVGLIEADVVPVLLLVAQLVVTVAATWDAHRCLLADRQRGIG